MVRGKKTRTQRRARSRRARSRRAQSRRAQSRRAQSRRARSRKAQKGGNDDLLNAVDNNNANLVAELLRKPGIDVNKTGWGPFSVTPLYIAASKGYAEIVARLVSDRRVDINKANRHGQTPLRAAAERAHNEVVKLLLEDPYQRVDVNISDTQHGYTPLLSAIVGLHSTTGTNNRFISVIKLLLDDPRVNVNKADNNGLTPLTEAVLKGSTDVVKLLLANSRVDINMAHKEFTPLFLAAAKGHTEIVKLLLEEDPYQRVIDVNKTDTDGDTPLYIAANNENTEVVQLLLADHRTVVDQKTKDAAKTGEFSPEIAQLILRPASSLPTYNVPRGATNTIMQDEIKEGDRMVNFHDDYAKHGRYYKQSVYDQLASPKKNPFTRLRIEPANLVHYKAHLVDPVNSKST